MAKTIKIATIDDEGKRFDNVARKAFSTLSLSLINKAIRKGNIRLNSQKVEANTKVKNGDELSFCGFLAENIQLIKIIANKEPKLNIIWQSDDFLAINKEAGQIVHSSQDSLEQAVIAYLGSNSSLSFKTGPCHRLDRNTSGIIVFAKTVFGARNFTDAMKNNQLEKSYIALFSGNIKSSVTWQDKLDYSNGKAFTSSLGKLAIMHVNPIKFIDNNTLALVKLETGRTHQIRVQASLHGHSLVGDKKYGYMGILELDQSYLLHAYALKSQSDTLFPPLIATIPSYFLNKVGLFSLDNNL